MIKTTVTPKSNKINLSIPNNYIGKEIEVLIYAKDEVDVDKERPKLSTRFAGSLKLSGEEYQNFQEAITQMRNEWDKNI